MFASAISSTVRFLRGVLVLSSGSVSPPSRRISSVMVTRYQYNFSFKHYARWQGDIFTSVCQEFCLQGGGGRGVCLSACWDTHIHTHPWADTPPPPDGHCSGRYASYWNASLLFFGMMPHSVLHKNYIGFHFILRSLLYLGGRLPSTITKFDIMRFLPPANEVWGKVIFLHLFLILFTGGMRGCSGGVLCCSGGSCMVAPRGCAWLFRGGHAWLLWGGHAWLLRGHAWLLPGGMDVALGGGMHGCSERGMRGIRWDKEIRSMSGLYAFYWNAFLLCSLLPPANDVAGR